MQTNKDNTIVNETFQFAIEVIYYCKELEGQKEFNISRQLFRSATSIGANVREAQNAESKVDFIHKMKLAAKETDETEYWLLLCNQISFYPTTEKLFDTSNSIHKILSKIISTSKKSLPNYQTTKLSN